MYPQETEYTCGVAAVRTLLKKLDKIPPNEKNLSGILDTTKEYGTNLNSILKYLLSKNVILYKKSNPSHPSNRGNRGLCLINVNTFYKDFPKDGQNGHWVYFEEVNDLKKKFKIYDPYFDKNFILLEEELYNHTNNILLGNKIYNNVILYIYHKGLK
jgi:hypothetical protein